MSDLALVLLFAVYLLLGRPSSQARDHVTDKVDAHIAAFIKGKVLLSLLTVTALPAACATMDVRREAP